MVDFNKPPKDELPRGQGESPRSEETGLTPAQEARLIATALNPRKRFRLSRQLKRQMVEQSRKHMLDLDTRVGVRGVSNLLAMERLNQLDEHKKLDKEQPDSVTNQQINIYLPQNGRETDAPQLTNGHATNGKH